MNLIDMAMALGLRQLLLSAVVLLPALWLARRRALSAEQRSWLLTAAMAVALLLPLSAFLPGWSTTLPAPAPPAAAFHPMPGEGATTEEAIFEAGRQPDIYYVELPKTLPTVLALLWLLGTLWLGMRLLDAMLHARRLRRLAQPASAGLRAVLADIVPAHVTIATCAVDGPMVVGLWRPQILLPRPLLARLDNNVLRDIVRHEVAHLDRRDLWTSTLLRAGTALFWWNPLLHLAQARLAVLREMACDARAAMQAREPLDYAGSLLASIEQLQALREEAPTLALGMFSARSQLAQRIDQLLDAASQSPRRRSLLMLGLLLLLACTGTAVAVSPRLASPPVASSSDTRVNTLLQAASTHDVAQVHALAAAGVDLDARVLGDGTALIQAIRARDPAMVDALLQLGADPDRAALGEGNPLIVASALGLQPIVEQLVQAGADVNRVVTYDETPLINASREGHLVTVQYLLAHGADINLGVEADGWLGRWRTPLNQAGNAAVRDYLLAQGARRERR
ncbi:M56 family metallopeptidase [Stenotrophomonas maltophilia]|uniref:M56 family metallopeptidase n=1 Tax=Stenotrophomonas maltophilia TaxID=40324 RepID=UPI0021C9409F|nr:M56 family metallopeptidase [Stenotrophomonas maltophilia]MCU1068225.1 ankyrin repeat domain-containing protein [Stenotrophomonas maltophilia]MCU1077087.1 ankyrin repeat domain-containing protein [Stenotrophomonas maltophilia]MCU1138635.1 ankyrin repeat domain-containing protein [Stenotrophomonas maltophilia]